MTIKIKSRHFCVVEIELGREMELLCDVGGMRGVPPVGWSAVATRLTCRWLQYIRHRLGGHGQCCR